VFDQPDIWNPEDHELEDLDLFRRVDRRLISLGLEHFMDIVDFDRKLAHALDGMELYGETKIARNGAKKSRLSEVLGLSLAGLDASLGKQFGRDYYAKEVDSRVKQSQADVTDLENSADAFADLKGLIGPLKKLFDKL
jgi:hypothetical protein